MTEKDCTEDSDYCMCDECTSMRRGMDDEEYSNC